MTDLRDRPAAISGFGISVVGRRLPRSALALTLDACLAAIEDAGLRREDIDGLATWPGAGFGTPGLAGPGTLEIQEALRLNLSWFMAGPEGGQLGPFVAACMAVATGLAEHVLVYRTVTEASAQGTGGRATTVLGDDGPVDGWRRWLMPFRAYTPVNWVALYAQRHMWAYGTTREQLGAVAVNTRANAANNPSAIYRHPLTMEEYLSARMISTPFGLYDCDVPCDGAVAFVVTRRDRPATGSRTPLVVDAVGTAVHGRPSFEQWEDLTTMAAHPAARHLWSRTTLTPADVDVASLYDGFSVLPLLWLEALGFCKPGESGPFVEGGTRIALGGELPLNTGGGQLSAGRLHGWGVLHEACVQLWGLGGDRQVAAPEVAVVGVGGGPLANAVLLTVGR
jgi:acetyl-CoA acetyltransferase